MRILHKHNLIYISIPRTGSTSLRKILDNYSDVSSEGNSSSNIFAHMNYQEILKEFPHLKNYSIMVNVREIEERFVSLFYHRIKHSEKFAKLSAISISLSFYYYLIRLIKLKNMRLESPIYEYIKGFKGNLYVVNMKDQNLRLFLLKNFSIDYEETILNKITPSNKIKLNFIQKFIIQFAYRKDKNLIKPYSYVLKL